MNGDRLIQGMAWDGDFRIIAAQTTESVETARAIRDLSPTAANALGRAMTGAVILARLLDKDVRNQYVTVRFEGNGPLGAVIAEANVTGSVRGYVANATYHDAKLDVGSAIGANGTLSVIRGVPPKGKSYTSQVRLVSGEIAKDIAHYLAHSEQILSAVLLGVLSKPTGVSAAGGMIVQAFPHASESAIEAMETRIREAPSFSLLLDKMPIEDAVQEILQGIDYKAIDPSFDIPISYSCSCNRERAFRQFIAFSLEELDEIIEVDRGAEVICQYCGRRYEFSVDDLLALNKSPDA